MSRNPLIVSFYTDDWKYPDHAANLIKNCSELGYEHYVANRPSKNDYIKNTAMKPFFIKECLHKYRRPLIWMDVDSVILKPFHLTISPEYDIGACKYTNEKLNREWAVAFLYFNYSARTIDFVNRWCSFSERGSDEYAFDLAWKSCPDIANFFTLSEDFHFVRWSKSIEVPDSTIICHQISQSDDKLKRKKDGQVKDFYD